jgi:hypothetical protein
MAGLLTDPAHYSPFQFGYDSKGITLAEAEIRNQLLNQIKVVYQETAITGCDDASVHIVAKLV